MSTNIVVPELGESVVEARVARWLKKPGDAVSAGDPLVELETEKIDLEVSADRAGVLGAVKYQEGADVKVGEVLAVLEESGAAAPAAKAPAPAPAAETPAAKAADKKATPTAKNVAKAHDVKIEAVEASSGRVTKQDILGFMEGKIAKWFKDSTLLEQQFVKDPERTIKELVDNVSAKTGEKISVARFTRFQVGGV